MSTEALHFALSDTRANTPVLKLVLILLADEAGSDGVVLIEPHLFAPACRLSLDDLRIAMRQLMHFGLIEKVQDPRIKQQTQAAFRVTGYDA